MLLVEALAGSNLEDQHASTPSVRDHIVGVGW